nr:C-type lectin domain family 4 member A-like isoform X2 [Meriones unguiculatus]
MASEITYAEVKFKNASNSSGTHSDSSAAPKKNPTHHQSKPGSPSLLFTSLMVFFLLLAISFLVAFIIWSCCPKDWEPFGSQCYFTLKNSNWSESKNRCSLMGAHLLVIYSQEEQDFITKILETGATYFIGLWDAGHRQWQWVDETPYNESATFWHEGEPSNPKEQCVTINYRKPVWGWNDIPCSDKQKSVCQAKKVYL